MTASALLLAGTALAVAPDRLVAAAAVVAAYGAFCALTAYRHRRRRQRRRANALSGPAE